MALDFFAGCVGGCAGLLVGHPFDTIKVRLQTDCVKKPRYKSATHCFVTTVKTESFLGLYKGISSPMVGIAFINAIIFGSYGTIYRQFKDQDALTTYFLAGGLAGITQAFIASPMELVKTRIQIQGQGSSSYSTLIGKKAPVQYKGPVDCVQKIYASEGLRGVFRGQCVTLLREFTGIGIYFSSYEYLTQRFLTDPNEKNSVLSTGELLLAGGLAGVISWIPTYPVDMVKSRLQVDGCNGPRQYKGAIDCAIKSYKEEGKKAFTRGMAPTILRAFPTNAATFTVVAWIMRLSGYVVPTEVDDKQEALVTEAPKSKIELKPTKETRESGFLTSLKGIGALTITKEMNRLAMYANPCKDSFLKDMQIVSQVTFLNEGLGKDYAEKMVPITLPSKDTEFQMEGKKDLNQDVTDKINGATKTLSSGNKSTLKKLSISDLFYLDLSQQDCELSAATPLPSKDMDVKKEERKDLNQDMTDKINNTTKTLTLRKLSISDLFYLDLSRQDCELSAATSHPWDKSELLTPKVTQISLQNNAPPSAAIPMKNTPPEETGQDETLPKASSISNSHSLEPDNNMDMSAEDLPSVTSQCQPADQILSDQRSTAQMEEYSQTTNCETRSQVLQEKDAAEKSRDAILLNTGIFIRNGKSCKTFHRGDNSTPKTGAAASTFNTDSTPAHNVKAAAPENNSYNLEDSEVAPCSPTCNHHTKCCQYSMDFNDQESRIVSAFNRRIFDGIVRNLKAGLFDLPVNYDV